MKIIGGERRGMNLLSPKGHKTRPMNARVKEALFNILADDVTDANVLDLFSGSGSLGLEALSRGARYCHFVENGEHALPVLEANIEKSGYQQVSKILRTSAFSVSKQLEGNHFDLFFFDPPYKFIDDPGTRKHFLQFIAHLAENYATTEFSMVLHHRRHSMMGIVIPPPVQIRDQRAYGSTELSFFGRLMDNRVYW